MAPASCSLWPCCRRGVTSCLSLCLFLALPEGPRGAGRGGDGSAADPRGCGPPGPGPACLPASAASADGHRLAARRSCRVPGPYSPPPFPHSAPFAAHAPPSRARALSQLPAGWLCHKLSPGPTASPPHTAGHASRVSHMPTHVCTHTFTQVYADPRTCRHKGTDARGIQGHKDSQIQPEMEIHSHTHTLTDLHISQPDKPYRCYNVLPLAV